MEVGGFLCPLSVWYNLIIMNLTYANKKATLASLAFFAIFVWAAKYIVVDWELSLPLAIFYVILILNTYFSVKLFSGITPKDNILQNIIDIILGTFYVLMLLNLNSPVSFYFLTLALFIFACMKYTFLLGVIDYPALLKRKIFVDLLGVLGCVIILALAVFNYSFAGWLFAGGFFIANIFVLWLWPIYRLD